MYTGLTWLTKDRYKYNAFKVLNVARASLPVYDYMTTARIESLKSQIKNNISNLINQLSGQFTTRQKNALTEVGTIITNQFSWQDFYGVHEFRFEGAGCYRAGYTDDSYSSNVSEVSVNFTSLNGYHNESGFPSDFNDGFGLYGAMSVVYRDGDIVGVFTRASTLPDKMESADTVAEGTYSFKVGTHPESGGYKALNLYELNNFTLAGRTLPAAIDKTLDDGISGVNSHKGFNTERGSEGCQTLQHDKDNQLDYTKSDYNDYIGLFNASEKGMFVIKRYVTLPNVYVFGN